MAYANESYFENKVYEASLRSKREKEEFHLHSQSSKALSSLNQRFGEKLRIVYDIFKNGWLHIHICLEELSV